MSENSPDSIADLMGADDNISQSDSERDSRPLTAQDEGGAVHGASSALILQQVRAPVPSASPACVEKGPGALAVSATPSLGRTRVCGAVAASAVPLQTVIRVNVAAVHSQCDVICAVSACQSVMPALPTQLAPPPPPPTTPPTLGWLRADSRALMVAPIALVIVPWHRLAEGASYIQCYLCGPPTTLDHLGPMQ